MTKNRKTNVQLCDARLWYVVPGESCPVCGAPATGSLCRAAHDKPTFDEWARTQNASPRTPPAEEARKRK
jgi:hypothetical protein